MQSLSILVYITFLYYKGGLYLIYIKRLQAAYNETAFEVNKYMLIYFRFVTISYFFIMATIISLYAFYLPDNGQHHLWNKDHKRCDYTFHIVIIMYFGFMEVTFPLITLYFFVRPLKNVWEHTKDDLLLNVAIKYSIITATIIFSTCLTVTMYSFFGGNFVTACDNSINAVLVLLYDNTFDYYYKFIFNKIHSKIYAKYKKENNPQIESIGSVSSHNMNIHADLESVTSKNKSVPH